MRLKFNRLLLCSMLMITLCLSGCVIPTGVVNSLKQSFDDRAMANRLIAQRLYESGLISQSTYNVLVRDIDSKLGDLTNGLSESNRSMEGLLRACVGWNIPPEPDHAVLVENEDGIMVFDHWFHSLSTDEANGACDGVMCADITGNAHALCLDGQANGTGGKLGGSGHITPQCESYVGLHITSYIANYKEKFMCITLEDGQTVITQNVPACMVKDATVDPIEVISESLFDTVKQDLSVKIMILRTEVSDERGIALDDVLAAVEEAKALGNTEDAANKLEMYFKEATYINPATGEEENLTILDSNKVVEQLVRPTIRNDGDPADRESPSKWYGRTVSPCTHDPNYFENFSSKGSIPGYDATVYMAGQPVLSVRLIEFNQNAVDELDKKLGLGENRYLVIAGNAYLMEYPLGYVDGFLETNDRTEYKSIIKRSQLGFNLLTREFSKFELDEYGNPTNKSHVISKDDPYLTYMLGGASVEDSISSIVIYGETGKSVKYGGEEQTNLEKACNAPWDLQFGEHDGKPYVASVGRLVLRDYLEGTYAPGIISGDSLVVLGRKLRILQFEGSKKNPVARFYGKDGVPLEGISTNLFINDFATIDTLLIAEPYVEYISAQKEPMEVKHGVKLPDGTMWYPSDSGDGYVEAGDSGDEGYTPSDGGDGSGDGGLADKISKISNLKSYVTNVIYPTTMFPGEHIGKSDYSETDNKQLFYAIVVKKNMFETGLFSGWVQSEDQSKDSVLWWNNWLSNHGYLYNINTDNLVDYLVGNFSYELNKSGVITLNLEVIAKIQQEFDGEKKQETAHWLRTVFVVLGYFLIAYAIVVLVAWNIDVNVDLGFNILEKLSFGRWVAIKNNDELPYINTDDISFINLGEILIKCIIIIGLGISLILVNIVDLMLMMINAFGGVSKYIIEIITGVG